MMNFLFLLLPFLCLSLESCTLEESLGLSGTAENIQECGTEEAEGAEGGGRNCSCTEGFEKCSLSLMQETRLGESKDETETVTEDVLEVDAKDQTETVADEDVLEVDGLRFARKYEGESFRLDENPCQFCCRNGTNEVEKTTKKAKLGTALTAGVMLGMILVVVLISIAVSKMTKCSAKADSEEKQEPEPEKLTYTV